MALLSVAKAARMSVNGNKRVSGCTVTERGRKFAEDVWGSVKETKVGSQV